MKLEKDIRLRAKKSYKLWIDDPFHPSLRFKCINQSENIWAVRVTLGYRALGVLDSNTSKLPDTSGSSRCGSKSKAYA